MTATAQPFVAARPRSGPLFDLVIMVAVLAGSLALPTHDGVDPSRPGPGGLDLLGVVLVTCSAVPLVAWRRFPLGVFIGTAAAGVGLAALGHQFTLMLGPTVALYLLAATRQLETPWTWRTTTIVVGLPIAYLGATAAAQATFPLHDVSGAGLAWAAAWFAGERTRLRREQIAELRERALRAERDKERERLLAVAEERTRIARDLHDSAAHGINVIAVRAGAARLRHYQDSDRSFRALQAIEEVARQMVGEIDHIVGTLRESGPRNGDIDVPIGLSSLDTLIAHHSEAGLEVASSTSGSPRPLVAAADQAAYRILQEALTNAARHGTGSVRVELVFDETAVEVTVINPVLRRSLPESGGGHGLIGMRERVTLLGGSLGTKRVNGAFLVHARIPYAGRPA